MGKMGEFWALPKIAMDDQRLKPEEKLIYAVLFTRRNGENEAWPSQRTLGKTIGCGERSVRRYILNLIKHGYISEIRQEGMNRTNRYLLADVPYGQFGPMQEATVGRSHEATAVAGPIVREHSKRTTLMRPEDAGDPVNKVFNVFYDSGVNPTINFGNRTTRTAAEWLVKKMGEDRAIAAAKYACSIQGQKYAPTITTPHQLKEKYAELRIYFQKNNQSKVGVVL